MTWKRAIAFSCLFLGGPVLAQAPTAPPASVEPVPEQRGTALTPESAAILSAGATLVGTTASLLWLTRGSADGGAAAGLLGVVLLTAPSAGRIVAGDAGGAMRHVGIRAATAAVGALATFGLAAASSYGDDSNPGPSTVMASLTLAALVGEALWDILTTREDLSAMNLGERRLSLSIAPLAGATLLKASGVPLFFPVVPGSPSSYTMPGFSIRAALEGRTFAGGILVQHAGQTHSVQYDPRFVNACVVPCVQSVDIGTTRLLFTLEGREKLGPLSAAAFAAGGVGSTSSHLVPSAASDGATAKRSELVLRIGPALEWAIIPVLSLRAEVSLDAKVMLGQSGSSSPSGDDATVGYSALGGIVLRL